MRINKPNMIEVSASEFAWPGFDLEPTAAGKIAYGFIPPRLHAQIRGRLLAAANERRLRRVGP